MPSWIVERGEAISFMVVAVVLIASVRPVARLLRVPGGIVDERYWWGGVLFLVVGRVAYVAGTTPGLLFDVMVLVRFTDGLEPLAGGAAALAYVGWTEWRSPAPGRSGAGWAIAATALTLAAATYSLACPLRETCVGITAPSPLGVPMHGLIEPRLPTPVIEGVLLLTVLAIAVRTTVTWPAWRIGWVLLGGLAGTRLLLMPLTVEGIDPLRASLLLVVVIAAAVGVWRSGVTDADREGAEQAGTTA